MGLDDSTDEDSQPTRPDDPVSLALERFSKELRAGLGPRIEDFLEGVDPPSRTRLLRLLILAEQEWRRELGLDPDRSSYRARFPGEAALIDEVFGEGPTATISTLDPVEIESCLHFGLLALANGMIAPEALTRALDAWAEAPPRPFGEVLIERGELDEATASMVASLAARHREIHQSNIWAALMTLGRAVRFRVDPDLVVNPTLRVLLAGFVADEADPRNDAATDFGTRYEILKHHASGGLGVVSLARDREIHREVAVKEIRADCANNADYRARFLREAEVTGRLEHPGIVPVYGMGQHADGRPYYAMRFIRGENLKVAIHRLHKPSPDGEEAATPGEGPDLHALVGRFIDACHAVAYAHHRKILHRDIKPINIMLGPFGETLVVDWGLAKSFDGPSSDQQAAEEGTLRPESGSELTPTRVGSQVGTVGYMSPEQAAGRLAELGPPSDIYSLGVTLHYLVTGHAPFEGASKEEFLKRVREGDFPRPTKVNPSVPRPLEAICLKAMALRPGDRYPSVGALVKDLEHWRAGQPVEAYPEPFADRLSRWARRHKTPLAGAAVLLICSTIGLALYAVNEREVNRQLEAKNESIRSAEARARAEWSSAQADLKLSRDSLRQTLVRLSDADFAYLPNSGPPRLKLAEKVVGSYQALFNQHPADPFVRSELAHASWITANIVRSMGDFDRAAGYYEKVFHLLGPLAAGNPDKDFDRLVLAAARIDMGENVRLSGWPRKAEPWYLQALELVTGPSIPARNDRYMGMEATARMDLAACRVDTGRPSQARSHAIMAVEIFATLTDRPKSEDRDRLNLIHALNVRSNVLLDLGEPGAARNDLDEAAQLAEELLRIPGQANNTDYRFSRALTSTNLGRWLRRLDDPAGAAEQFDAASTALETLWRENQRVAVHDLERLYAIISTGPGANAA